MSYRSRKGLVTTLAGSVVLTLSTAPARADLELDRAFLDAGPLKAPSKAEAVKSEKLQVKASDAKLSIALSSTKDRIAGLFVSPKSAAGPFTLLEGTRVVAGQDGAAQIEADLSPLTSGAKKAPNLHVLVATAVWDGKAFTDVRATHAASVKVEAGKITHIAGKATSSALTAETLSKTGLKAGTSIVAPSGTTSASSTTAITASALFPPRSGKRR